MFAYLIQNVMDVSAELIARLFGYFRFDQGNIGKRGRALIQACSLFHLQTSHVCGPSRSRTKVNCHIAHSVHARSTTSRIWFEYLQGSWMKKELYSIGH